MEGAIKKGQPRETGNIGYTRQRKTKQNQSRETGNMWYTRRRKTKQNHNATCAEPHHTPYLVHRLIT